MRSAKTSYSPAKLLRDRNLLQPVPFFWRQIRYAAILQNIQQLGVSEWKQ